MLVAGIDIGTNSMRILMTDFLYEKEKDKVYFNNRTKKVNSTRIGKNIHITKEIDEETYQRNMDAFEEFVEEARSNKAEKIYAIGTSALRDAQNGEQFITQAERKTGIKIEIITGTFEAELAFYGVSSGLEDRGRLLIIDIGGGSTEFVIGSKIEGILFRKSIDLGAVRLTEMFGDDIQAMKKYIIAELDIVEDLIERFSIKKVVGIGGTITTISAINQAVQTYDSDRIHNSILKKANVDYIFRSLIALNADEKKMVVGLPASRADIIVAGVNILTSTMGFMGFSELIVSDYDNLEGMIYYYMKDE